ncbi:MAG: sulfurtransferase TusA family protein [gamma proteobacterium symbiont of Taylorina sp.]|nr:sulfurtransferase TusA family protein [gamma proteobacterium symbiont of Taylorina sp.]
MSKDLVFEEKLDVRELDCPMPIMKTKAMLARMASGDQLDIVANNREFIKEIQTFSAQMGHTILSEDTEGEILSFVIEKK